MEVIGWGREREGTQMKVVADTRWGLGKEILGEGWGWRLRIRCGIEDGRADESWAVSGYWLDS